jgi:L-aspartate oxidase
MATPIAPDLAPEALQTLRKAMSEGAGVVRDAAGLTAALEVIARLEAAAPGALPLVAARLIAEAALARRESRGGISPTYAGRSLRARHAALCRSPRRIER